MVTEYISSEKTMRCLAEILDRQNVNYDIATISLSQQAKKYFYWEIIQRGHRLFYGKVEEEDVAPEDFYRQSEKLRLKKYLINKAPFRKKSKTSIKE